MPAEGLTAGLPPHYTPQTSAFNPVHPTMQGLHALPASDCPRVSGRAQTQQAQDTSLMNPLRYSQPSVRSRQQYLAQPQYPGTPEQCQMSLPVPPQPFSARQHILSPSRCSQKASVEPTQPCWPKAQLPSQRDAIVPRRKDFSRDELMWDAMDEPLESQGTLGTGMTQPAAGTSSRGGCDTMNRQLTVPVWPNRPASTSSNQDYSSGYSDAAYDCPGSGLSLQAQALTIVCQHCGQVEYYPFLVPCHQALFCHHCWLACGCLLYISA